MKMNFFSVPQNCSNTPLVILFRKPLMGLNDQMARLNDGRGRPSKGDRDAFVTRPARPVGDEIRQRADAAGMHYGEYIAAVLAREVGMPELAPVPSVSADQEALPIKRSA